MKKRSTQDRRRIIAEYRSSGMSATKFCRKQGIHFTTLYSWMRSLGKRRAASGFRRLKISPLSGLGEAVVAEIMLGNGARVRLMRGIVEAEVGMILEAASRCGN